MEQWLNYAVLGRDGINVSFCSKGVNKTAENYYTYLWWKFMDLSLSQNFFNLDTYFFRTESFENHKKRSWTRNFDQSGPRLDFVSCKGFQVQSKPLKNFLSIKLYKPFYKIISRNYKLRKFWSIDFSSCFDFRYFLVSRESSCHASRCELIIRNLRSGPILAVLIHSL